MSGTPFADFAPYDRQLEIGGKKTSLARLLIIDKEDLSSEFAKHAAWLGWVGILTAEAEDLYEAAKLELEELEAIKDSEARLALSNLTDSQGKPIKPTEPMIANWIAMDDAIIAAKRLKAEKYKEWKVLRAAEKAMMEKGSMLVSLGATMRQEIDMTDLKIRLGVNRGRED